MLAMPSWHASKSSVDGDGTEVIVRIRSRGSRPVGEGFVTENLLRRFRLPLQLPAFVEEVGVVDAAGSVGVRRLGDVDDGPVGKFGVLLGVGAVVGFAEGEAGVEDDVVPEICSQGR